MADLLIGAGSNHDRRINTTRTEWDHLVTLDINPDHHPDIVHDLEVLPYPFKDNEFDEIHAYEVLEHIGHQGNYLEFFAQFEELHRILKSDGLLCVTVPLYTSEWAWGDPGHRRVITPGTLAFLSQSQYQEQIGKTSMTDYRFCYKGNFECVFLRQMDDNMAFVLKALK